MKASKIDITNFDSTEPEFLGPDGPVRFKPRGQTPEEWYAERQRAYAKDYSKPWFDAAKITAIVAAILILIDLFK